LVTGLYLLKYLDSHNFYYAYSDICYVLFFCVQEQFPSFISLLGNISLDILLKKHYSDRWFSLSAQLEKNVTHEKSNTNLIGLSRLISSNVMSNSRDDTDEYVSKRLLSTVVTFDFPSTSIQQHTYLNTRNKKLTQSQFVYFAVFHENRLNYLSFCMCVYVSVKKLCHVGLLLLFNEKYT